MPVYYFDVYDGLKVYQDRDGQEFESLERVRKEAQRLLPEIAYHEIPNDGDHRSLVTLVRDESGKPIFSATLNYHGLWLGDAEEDAGPPAS